MEELSYVLIKDFFRFCFFTAAHFHLAGRSLLGFGLPVVRTDGPTYGHVTTKISRMHSLPNFLFRCAPLRVLHARESSP